jgi:hypothetical protein
MKDLIHGKLLLIKNMKGGVKMKAIVTELQYEVDGVKLFKAHITKGNDFSIMFDGGTAYYSDNVVSDEEFLLSKGYFEAVADDFIIDWNGFLEV